MTEVLSFGEWVQELRNELGLTRSNLAMQVGCSPATIKKIERDERRPSVQVARLLAEKLLIPEKDHKTFVRQARGMMVQRPTRQTQPLSPKTVERKRPSPLPPIFTQYKTPFFGRHDEREKIGQMLTNPEARLITILGQGGIGKTRLAIEIAKTHAKHFPDGIFFIRLSSVDPESFTGQLDPITASLATALNFSFHSTAPPESQLSDYVSDKEMLLLFDNFEHLIEHALIVDEILTAAPYTKILVTTRERLSLQDEWIVDLSALNMETAVTLFEKRALQAKHDFNFAANETAVREICQLVDRLPLSIELAASWVRLMPLPAIITEIEKSIDFLSTRTRNIPPRHRSLRAVFESSWKLLSSDEQIELQKLSIFRGGFRREAAEEISGASIWSLSSLADKSLLKIRRSQMNGSKMSRSQTGHLPLSRDRYRIHRQLRQFAAEKLPEANETQLRERHARFYINLLAQQESRLKTNQVKDALGTITDDFDNIRIALRWPNLKNWHEQIKPLLHALSIYFDIQGGYYEGIEILTAHAETLEQQEANAETNLMLGWMYCYIAWWRNRIGYLQLSEKIIQKSYQKFEASPLTTPNHLADYYHFAGSILLLDGKSTIGLDYLQKSLTLYQETGDRWNQALVISAIGQTSFSIGKLEEAESMALSSNQLLASEDDHIFFAYNLGMLGNVAAERGDYDKAAKLLQDSLAIRQDIGNLYGSQVSLTELGDLSLLQGDYAAAHDHYTQANAIVQKLGVSDSAILWGLGNLAVREKAYQKALTIFQERERIYGADVSNTITSNSVLAGPGWAYFGLGDWAMAQSSFQKLLFNSWEYDVPKWALEAMLGMAYLRADEGELETAVHWLILIHSHPKTVQDTRQRAQTLLEKLAADYTSEKWATAQQTAQSLDLWQIAESLLGDE